jgi:competence protein ComEC
MVKIAIAFLLGCALCLNLSELPRYGWLLAVALPFTFRFRQTVLSAFIVGLLWAGFQAQLRIDQRLPEHKASQDSLLSGVIASIPEQHDQILRFNFRSQHPDFPPLLRLSWYYPESKLPAPGEHWQLRVRLKPPAGMKNPGGFDYEKWLFTEGIGATGYVRKHPDNRRLAPASDWQLDKLRLQIQHKLTALLKDSQQLPSILGLSVGQRDLLNTEHWRVLRETGTSHLLAISGLHIGLAAALGFFLFRWSWSLSLTALSLLPARQAGALGGFSFALFYALLAGMAIPTQRALIMVSTVMLALLLKRPLYPGHILALSLLLVLLFDPFSVLSAGFWLSFSAVALILLTCSARFPAKRGNWVWIHLWLALGLMPLLIIFFGQISLISPLANLIAVPLVSLLVVPLILAGMLLLVISDPISHLALSVADYLLGWLWQMLNWLASLPLADWQLPAMPWWLTALIGLLTVLLLLPRAMPARWLGLLTILALISYSPARPPAGQIYFTLLDVGQGLAAVVETHSHTLVFDTGPRYSERFDTGSAVVVPYLQSRGIEKIDRLLISHGDNDHIGGVNGLKQHLPVTKLISSDVATLPGARPCEAGQQWRWDEVLFEVLLPLADQPGSDNNRSCVLKVTADNMTLLLPGDIERESERQLLARYGGQLKADILVVPHHGSLTSSGIRFVQTVKPGYALFPVGYRNRYGFPKQKVVDRYLNEASIILRSDQHGAILFRDEQVVTTWRQNAAGLWTANY